MAGRLSSGAGEAVRTGLEMRDVLSEGELDGLEKMENRLLSLLVCATTEEGLAEARTPAAVQGSGAFPLVSRARCRRRRGEGAKAYLGLDQLRCRRHRLHRNGGHEDRG